jgi:N-acetylglutamate synthase
VLGPHDIGHRVVVRRIIGVRAGRPFMTDALGTLISITDTELTVETRTGPVIISRAAVVAAKRVPPRPPRAPKPQ